MEAWCTIQMEIHRPVRPEVSWICSEATSTYVRDSAHAVSVEPEVYARQRVNRLHRFEREPMPESAE